MIAHCRGLLAFAFALALVGCAPASEPRSPWRHHLGVLRLNDPFSARKIVILRGTILSGQVRATYADGVSYLDSARWRWVEPLPPPPQPARALAAGDPAPGATTRLTPAADLEARVRPTVLTLAAAQEDFSRLERVMDVGSPVVVIESASMHIIFVGEDALRAFAEIDSLRSGGGRDIAARTPALPDPVREEILGQVRTPTPSGR